MPSGKHGRARYGISVRGKSAASAAKGARGGKGGMVLILALGVLILVSMLAIFFYTVTRGEKQISLDEVNLIRAEMLAQGGMEIVKTHLRRPPRDVAWANPIQLQTYFDLPTEEMGDTTTKVLPLHHPDTPILLNDDNNAVCWDKIVVPGFEDRSTDEFSIRPGAALPTFLREKFSDGEPFEDTGYQISGSSELIGAGDKKFSFYDENNNGVHDREETTHEPFSTEQDLNNNGVHDSYSGGVTFAIDDNGGTYSLSVLDNGGLIHINGGEMLGDDWLPEWADDRYSKSRKAKLRRWLVKQHSRHVIKMLDNLGIILGMCSEENTYYHDDDDDDRLKPTGEGLGHLLINERHEWNWDGRPEGGYSSKREVRAVLSEIRRRFYPSITDKQIDIFLAMITTVAWVDKTTVVGARFLYPEEYNEYLGEERNDYIVLTQMEDEYCSILKTVLQITGCNPTGILTPGRAEEDAEPRYAFDDEFDDEEVFPDPDYICDDSPYDEDKDPRDNTKVIEGFDKDDDLDNLMGWLYEPRAPINVNSAPQPVIEAALTYLEATYVTDRENNLYPNSNSIFDWRTDKMIWAGTPAYNFTFDERADIPFDRHDAQLYYESMVGGLYNWHSGLLDEFNTAPAESITELIERVNPTIRDTPSIVILPEEARAIAAAIVEYRNGGDSFKDRNNNGILDYGDDSGHEDSDKDYDGLLEMEGGDDWYDMNGDGFFQGGPFRNHEEFWVFLNMQKFRLFQVKMIPNEPQSICYGIPYRKDHKLDSRATNLLDMKVDLVFANANPNVDTMRFNPNASWASLNRVDSRGYYQRRNVTKFDLFDVKGKPTHTTEFCFQPTGIFQIESTGRVLASDGTLLAERRIRSAVKVFETMRLTSQKDFEMGVNPKEYKENDIETHDDHFFNSNIAEKTHIMTLPEHEWRATGLDGNPRKSGWQANAAGYDGQITLMTTFITDNDMLASRAGPYALRAYARFSAGEGGENIDSLGGEFTDTEEESHVQDEFNLRLTTTYNDDYAMGWIRASGHRQNKDTHNWDYDYENHRIHTSYDGHDANGDGTLDYNGELDYGRAEKEWHEEWNEGEGEFGYSFPSEYEPTTSIIIRPMLEPEQYPLVGSYKMTTSGSYHARIFSQQYMIFPFYRKTLQMYNNYHVFPMTVPRYDHESNLAADGFLKCGFRNTISYDLRRPDDSLTDEKSKLLRRFVDSLFDEWYYSSDKCLSFLVEMWVKPMFSATDNNNSVHDGNWEDMMKSLDNCRWPRWSCQPGETQYSLYPDLFLPPESRHRFLNIDFKYYFPGLTGGLPQAGYEQPGIPRKLKGEQGTKLSASFFLHPLQYDRFWRVDDKKIYKSYVWFRRRPVNFQFEDRTKQNTGDEAFTMLSRYTDDPDPDSDSGDPIYDNNVDNINHFIRDGEWFHLAVICLPDEVIWLLNGKEVAIPGYKQLPGSIPFAHWGIKKIELPDFACTFDELRIYSLADGTAFEVLRDHLSDGRYFDEGTYISPEIPLPKNTRIEGINWTQFIPLTLDTDEPNVTIYLLDGDGRPVRDENGHNVKLDDPNNTKAIGAFLDSFKLKIVIEASPNSDFFDQIDPMRDCLADTPAINDITIYYSCQEEVLLWELVE